MSGPMPYYLEKGMTFEVIEDFINAGGAPLLAAVESLRQLDAQGNYLNPMVDCGVFDSPSLFFTQSAADAGTTGPVDWTPDRWHQHMDQHWFGCRDETKAPVDPKAASSLAAAKSWWINYFGENVQDIVRETFLRGIETAWGVAHGDPLVLPPGRSKPWTVQIFWKCGQPWFEGWITWRKMGGRSHEGMVTILLCTPSEDTGRHYVWESPIPADLDGVNDGDPYPRGVGRLGQEESGMVVVTHTDNMPLGMTPGQIPSQQAGGLVPPLPGAVFHGTGPIVAVRPAQRRGGTGAAPRRWTPPVSNKP